MSAWGAVAIDEFETLVTRSATDSEVEQSSWIRPRVPS